ncbi:MAG: sugar transferase [Alloprevotella sp.]|nr:sugar transferase [Alloprevotella sp.]
MQTKTVNRRTEQREVRLAMKPWQRIMKRVLDILCALVGLIFLSPIFLAAYIALKLQGDGPVIFSQERIGRSGKPFRIFKFRTMHTDAEADGPQLYTEGDSRLTKVGAFLRDHHIDELPQFWNVLVGDMSMVGYRPERQFFIDQIMEQDPRYRYLFQMRPGVTSEATLYNGYTDTMEKMLERLNMDLRYMETATLRKDILIMLKTFGVMA